MPNLPRLAQNSNTIDGRPVVETLALSGGGGDGAFGAGVLTGWSERGTRPEFEIVTGVSAGAIIAPFAFLGPRYDKQLKEIWTQYQTNEVITTSILPGLLGGPALADNAPLVALIAQYIDKKMLRAVAHEYSKGRMLFVLTTNLDAQRPVVWNMGEIARHGDEEALDLFRKVILASAAIPGALPPVSIPVVAGNKPYDELHVDGGVTREVFVLPVQAPFKAFDALYPAPPIRRLYIIKNGKLTPESAVTKPQAISIAARAILTLTKSQNLLELYRISRLAEDAGADFNLLAVPPTFTMKAKEFFDPEYQARTIRRGPQNWPQRRTVDEETDAAADCCCGQVAVIASRALSPTQSTSPIPHPYQSRNSRLPFRTAGKCSASGCWRARLTVTALRKRNHSSE